MSAQTPRASGDSKDAAAPLETASAGATGAAKTSVKAPPLPQGRPATSRPPPLPPLPSARAQPPTAPPASEAQPSPPGTTPTANASGAPKQQPAKAAAPAPVAGWAGDGRLHVSVKTSVRDPQLLIVRLLPEGQPAPPGSREAFLVLVGTEGKVTGNSDGSGS